MPASGDVPKLPAYKGTSLSATRFVFDAGPRARGQKTSNMITVTFLVAAILAIFGSIRRVGKPHEPAFLPKCRIKEIPNEKESYLVALFKQKDM